MGESDRYQEYKHLKKKRFLLGGDNNALTALFILNTIFFLLLLTMQVVYFFYQQTAESYNSGILQWFELPSDLIRLSDRPWTLLTYMFSDNSSGLMRIISNMLWLWTFGFSLQRMTGNDKIIPIYLYGGFAGAVFFIGAHYAIPNLHNNGFQNSMIGANAAVMAVATATTVLDPDQRFFAHIRKGIPIWVLLTVYIIIDFAGVASMNAAYALSHLGGIIAGFLFVYFLKKGKDGSIWMNKGYHRLANLFNPDKPKNKQTLKNKVFYNTGNRTPFSKTSMVNQNRIDEILDKINSSGYHFLTEEEKEVLRKASEDNNK
ncbi:MAG: rhomboid family intramembrane serine protease [Bacteroidota bacterium]